MYLSPAPEPQTRPRRPERGALLQNICACFGALRRSRSSDAAAAGCTSTTLGTRSEARRAGSV
eukprot:994209-Alexandrium_andersonii.AAC.1